MAALALLEDLANGRVRRERVFRDHTHLLAQDGDWLMSRFRLRAIILELCAELGPALERGTLGFLATGAFQRERADQSGVYQSSLSCAMPAVWDGRIMARNITFPYTVTEQANIKVQFAAMSRFQNVIGAIDCTHIAIRAPSDNEFAYVNRKHFHSINVQIICDAQMYITNVVAQWLGSTHDSFILRSSSVGDRLQAGAVQDGWLLDGTRTAIQRTGGVLLYTPQKVCRIMQACSVLHNVAIHHGVPVPEELQIEEPDPGPAPHVSKNQLPDSAVWM
ncbi:putative nuclease HARBI1 [Labrus mixtus]|uniref:putative nuclease HARBI1 n=1 Tax=Labrus mixtus TaxID=508554 RepID=UPI0029C0C6EA|nr:putative nuclease HARBI1 [Labrus mixtus]